MRTTIRKLLLNAASIHEHLPRKVRETITIHKAKTHLSQLIAEAEAGNEVI